MVYALRGALGDVLFQRGLPRADHASAYQALFNTRHLQLYRRQVPCPLLLDVGVEGGRIKVMARLFGFADLWRDELLAALISALNRGVSISENSSERSPWEVLDFHYMQHQRVPEVPDGPNLRVCPKSALCFGAEEHLRWEPERFVLAAFSRVTLMARWHRVLLNVSMPGLAEARSRTRPRLGRQGPATRLYKASRQHPKRHMTLVGEASELLLYVPDPDWREALALASNCGAGGHTVYGFGRFHLRQA
ncbi:hypothetical protein [Sedimentitalea todarodis]|uniref:CRISPR-associated protein Cas6 C-terminal domain-containing protein n=1 Tax=Sedimentitalea todarodis TaxID=1631240 RepID=A0ABU3VE98_9RHOB|nr:hypothetical protein [Sedimentitalea todarodis]MDU9004486.1 hypothetical protein [Sedimentitalea todarodis]